MFDVRCYIVLLYIILYIIHILLYTIIYYYILLLYIIYYTYIISYTIIYYYTYTIIISYTILFSSSSDLFLSFPSSSSSPLSSSVSYSSFSLFLPLLFHPILFLIPFHSIRVGIWIYLFILYSSVPFSFPSLHFPIYFLHLPFPILLFYSSDLSSLPSFSSLLFFFPSHPFLSYSPLPSSLSFTPHLIPYLLPCLSSSSVPFPILFLPQSNLSSIPPPIPLPLQSFPLLFSSSKVYVSVFIVGYLYLLIF